MLQTRPRLAALVGCLVISNGTNIALFWPVSQRAHLLMVMVLG